MKLSVWAKEKGLCYRTAWNMFHRGEISNAEQLPSGTIIVNLKKEKDYISLLLLAQGRTIEVINKQLDNKKDLMEDFVYSKIIWSP